MLTKYMLKHIMPTIRFMTGITKHSEISKDWIRWVAVKKHNDFWCIYYGNPETSLDGILKEGNILFLKSIITKLVPCDDEAWDLYKVD